MNRFFYILLLCTTLAGLIYYGKKYNPSITLAMCLDAPEAYDGQTLFIGTEITVRDVWPDGFSIHQMGRIVPVRGDSRNLKRGDSVQLLAQFHAPDHLELKKLYVARKRRWKIILSILPVFLVAAGLCCYFKIDWQKFAIVERTRCRIS